MQRALIVSTQASDLAELRSVFKARVRLDAFNDLDRAIHAMDQARYDMIFADIDLLVPHQANLRINEMAARRMGLRPDQVFNNILLCFLTNQCDVGHIHKSHTAFT